MISPESVRELRREFMQWSPEPSLLAIFDKLERCAVYDEQLRHLHENKLALRKARGVLQNMRSLLAGNAQADTFADMAIEGIDKALEQLSIQVRSLHKERDAHAADGHHTLPELRQSSED